MARASAGLTALCALALNGRAVAATIVSAIDRTNDFMVWNLLYIARTLLERMYARRVQRGPPHGRESRLFLGLRCLSENRRGRIPGTLAISRGMDPPRVLTFDLGGVL